jgi:hypothetical protein
MQNKKSNFSTGKIVAKNDKCTQEKEWVADQTASIFNF